MRCNRAFAPLCLVIVLVSCSSPTQPSGSTPTVTAITPNTGTTLGGTVITITGTNFATGDSVTLGGAAATNVTIASSTTITATTSQRASGVVDVSVSIGGRTATLPGAFTYIAPNPVVNTPPTIASLAARGLRSNEPPQFSDLDEEIDVVATVQDAETPVSQLTYEWTSSAGGTFTGTGATEKWRAPQTASTPVNVTLTLTVIERYVSYDANGLPITSENRVSKSIDVSLHNSTAEIGDMARQFILDFSDSNIRDVSYIMRNFTDATRFCADGKASETSDVQHNRDTFRITAYSVGPATVNVAFGGNCPQYGAPGDACGFVPADWTSKRLADGSFEHVVGTDQLAAIYVPGQQRWGLCSSYFSGAYVPGSRRDFIR